MREGYVGEFLLVQSSDLTIQSLVVLDANLKDSRICLRLNCICIITRKASDQLN